jgi:putative peptidoglycan lipid II flippase
MSGTRALARAGLIVTLAFLVSRVLGYVRVAVIAQPGLDGNLDAFFAAFRIPDLIFQLVAAGALSSALIPVVGGLLADGQRERAWRVVGTVLNLMLVGLAVLSLVLFVAAPTIVDAITAFEPARRDLTVELTRIMLASAIMLALGSVATSVLNAEGRFAASALAPIVYNLGIIGGALFLRPSIGMAGLALGVVAGSVGHLAIQLRPLARIGFRYVPRIHLVDPEARTALALMAPRALGLGATQIAFVAMTGFASGLPPGSVSAFNLAMTLLQIPLGVIGVPLGIVILPALVRELASGRTAEFLRLVSRALRLLVFVMLPIAVLGIVLREEIVRLLFDHGGFTERDVALTADAFAVFLLGLVAHSLIAVLARAFYAGQDTRTPVAAAIVSVVANIVIGAALVGTIGLNGLAAAIAAGAWIEAAILVVALHRRYPELDLRGVGLTLARATAGAAIAGGPAAGDPATLGPRLGAEPGPLVLAGLSAAAAGVGAVGYLAMSVALRAPEMPALIGVATDLVRRPRTS